jgi:hypothetical protein
MEDLSRQFPTIFKNPTIKRGKPCAVLSEEETAGLLSLGLTVEQIGRFVSQGMTNERAQVYINLCASPEKVIDSENDFAMMKCFDLHTKAELAQAKEELREYNALMALMAQKTEEKTEN